MIRFGSTIRFDLFFTILQLLKPLDTIIIRKQAEFLGFILAIFRKQIVKANKHSTQKYKNHLIIRKRTKKYRHLIRYSIKQQKESQFLSL